jgi:hypothetical protein
MAHNVTRVLCLRLTRTSSRCALAIVDNEALMEASGSQHAAPSTPAPSTSSSSLLPEEEEQRSLLQIIQDDLRLSLLMTGQAVWAYPENSKHFGPGSND